MEELVVIDGCGNPELKKCFDCDLEKAGGNLEHCGMCEEGWQRALGKLYDLEKILGKDISMDRLRELVKADREGRVKILAPAMLATCGSCTAFQRIPGTASGICEKREQFKAFQKRPCCKMYEAREDCE